MYNYIFKGVSHTDSSTEYMKNLGMNDEQIESVLMQKEYELGDGMINKRREAYLTESDPLFIEATFDNDDAKMQAWRDKVIEIKAIFPIGNV